MTEVGPAVSSFRAGEHEELERQVKRQYDLRSREISGAVGQLSAVRWPLGREATGEDR